MNINVAISNSPYANQLGLQLIESDSDGFTFCIQPEERFIGNPVIEAFHGGVICGLMESSMSVTLMHVLSLPQPPRIINQTTSFLGSATIQSPIYVRTEMTKPGKRIVGAYARAYQSNTSQLVAKSSSLFAINTDSTGS
jgi:acyl-coenzyme A thioesterase PaaI-like protein